MFVFSSRTGHRTQSGGHNTTKKSSSHFRRGEGGEGAITSLVSSVSLSLSHKCTAAITDWRRRISIGPSKHNLLSYACAWKQSCFNSRIVTTRFGIGQFAMHCIPPNSNVFNNNSPHGSETSLTWFFFLWSQIGSFIGTPYYFLLEVR